jgi:hypothetical protein
VPYTESGWTGVPPSATLYFVKSGVLTRKLRKAIGGQFSLSFRFYLPMGDCCIYLPLNNTMSSLSTAVPIDVENRRKHVVKEHSILSLLTVQFVLGAFALSRLPYFDKPTGCQQPFQGRNMSGLRQNDNCFIAVVLRPTLPAHRRSALAASPLSASSSVSALVVGASS